jgi:hypothetical protein
MTPAPSALPAPILWSPPRLRGRDDLTISASFLYDRSRTTDGKYEYPRAQLVIRITFKHTTVAILHEEFEAGAVFKTIDLSSTVVIERFVFDSARAWPPPDDGVSRSTNSSESSGLAAVLIGDGISAGAIPAR